MAWLEWKLSVKLGLLLNSNHNLTVYEAYLELEGKHSLQEIHKDLAGLVRENFALKVYGLVGYWSKKMIYKYVDRDHVPRRAEDYTEDCPFPANVVDMDRPLEVYVRAREYDGEQLFNSIEDRGIFVCGHNCNWNGVVKRWDGCSWRNEFFFNLKVGDIWRTPPPPQPEFPPPSQKLLDKASRISSNDRQP